MNRLHPSAKCKGTEMQGPKASFLEDQLGFRPQVVT